MRPEYTDNCGELRVRRFAFIGGEEMARVCVFVDGEKFRHNIGDLFYPEFQRSDYLPKQADWTKLFNWIVEQSSDDATRVRTYWYVVQYLDFSHFGLDRLRDNAAKAETVLRKHASYKNELEAIADATAKEQRVVEIIDTLRERQEQIQRRFDGWTRIQNGIAREHDAVEFRRAGGIRYDLIDRQFGSEKAVDVNLACDMVVLKDIYDVAVIVSGDQDYVPAVGLIKDAGKRVINVAFKARNGRLLPGGARRLNETTDRGMLIEHHELAQYLGIPAGSNPIQHPAP